MLLAWSKKSLATKKRMACSRRLCSVRMSLASSFCSRVVGLETAWSTQVHCGLPDCEPICTAGQGAEHCQLQVSPCKQPMEARHRYAALMLCSSSSSGSSSWIGRQLRSCCIARQDASMERRHAPLEAGCAAACHLSRLCRPACHLCVPCRQDALQSAVTQPLAVCAMPFSRHACHVRLLLPPLDLHPTPLPPPPPPRGPFHTHTFPSLCH